MATALHLRGSYRRLFDILTVGLRDMKKKITLGLLISLFLLWLAVRKVNLQEFAMAITNIRVAYLVPAFLLTLVVCVVRSLRWRLLFSQTKDIRINSLLSVIMIGFLANNLLPARLGEVVMAYLIGKNEDISKSLALGTIFMDRILDVTTLMLFLAGTIVFNPFPLWVKKIALAGMILLIVATVAAWLAVGKKKAFMRLLRSCMKPFPSSLTEKILLICGNFIDGLTVIRNLPVFLKALVTSAIIWSGLTLGVYLLFLSFGFSLNCGAALTVLAIVNLGLIIPSAPGFVGTFQFLCVIALGLFQIPESQALGFAIIYHLSQYVPTTVAGFYYLGKEHLTLGQLASQKKNLAYDVRR
jgi:uncharacterized protein (TIRG00374 family)